MEELGNVSVAYESEISEKPGRPTGCKSMIKPDPKMFCEPEVRKVKAVCSKIEAIPPCGSENIKPSLSRKLLGPVTLLHYAPTFPSHDKAALVNSALKRRRGRLRKLSAKAMMDHSHEESNVTDDHLWRVSDLDIPKMEDPAVLKTRRTLSDFGRDAMIGQKLRWVLNECLIDWRLSKEVCTSLEKDPSLSQLFLKVPHDDIAKTTEMRQIVIKEILENEDLFNKAVRSLESQALVKCVEDDFEFAKKLVKCTELQKIIKEANENEFLKKTILSTHKNTREKIKNKAKFSPMSPWVDLPHWYALLNHVYKQNPPKEIQPFLLIDCTMEKKTSSMYTFHKEYVRNADQSMLHDFVTEIIMLVLADESDNVSETLESNLEYDSVAVLNVLGEAIANREGILKEIDTLKGYVKRIEDCDNDWLDVQTMYEKSTPPERPLWSFENIFSQTLHPMNAGELLDEVLLRKESVPFPSTLRSEELSKRSGVKSEEEKPKAPEDYLTESDVERSRVLNKYGRLSIARSISKKSAYNPMNDPQNSLAEIDEINTENTYRRPSRIRFAVQDIQSVPSNTSIQSSFRRTSMRRKSVLDDINELQNQITSPKKTPTSAKTV